MPPFRDFTRRSFIAGSSAAAGAALGFPVQAQNTSQAAGRASEFVVPPPKVITGVTRPLLAGNTARPLRYRPVDGDFVIRNGGEFFNRPLYGPNINFRVDAGDLPEFSLYLPGHGGNLKLGLSAARGSKWLAQAAEVITRYPSGTHDIRGSGTIRILRFQPATTTFLSAPTPAANRRCGPEARATKCERPREIPLAAGTATGDKHRLSIPALGKPALFRTRELRDPKCCRSAAKGT